MSFNLSLRNRIMMLIIIITTVTSIILIYTTYQSGKKALTKSIAQKLTSVRAAKQNQIENYLQEVNSFVEILGHNPYIADALRDFKRGYRQLSNNNIDKQCAADLEIFYEEFLKKVSENIAVKNEIEMYHPKDGNACYLQHNYIVKNPNPNGQKHLMEDAGLNNAYNSAHIKHHNYLTKIILEYGFYDIFLIDLQSGDIVYTAFKETDFATNLYTGPYAESNLADLARELKTKKDYDEPILVDYESYRPSYGAPAAFIGMTITDKSESVGALVLQLPADKINKVMTGNNNWEEDGLGKSGETYLVGDDFRMRSISRFFLEDTIGFRNTLNDLSIDEKEIDKMYKMGTTILNQTVKTDAVKEALLGKVDTKVIEDYRGVEVLSSYSPIDFPGLKWVILSEIDLAEVKKPILDFQRKLFTTLALLLTIVAFAALWLSNKLTRPLVDLKHALLNLNDSNEVKELKFTGPDELGSLGKHFNDLSNDLKVQKNLLDKSKDANEKLLLNFMPPSIANRLQKGETDLTETHEDVSLIVADIVDFTDFVKIKGDKDSVQLLNELIDAFDEAADRHHIEKLRTVGDTYMASCGMLTQRLDHPKRTIEFAEEVVEIINKFNIAHPEFELTVNIGIASGEVVAGIVGTQHFNFDILGSTMDQVTALKDLELQNTILTNDNLKQRMSSFFKFKKVKSTGLDFDVWSVVSENA